MDLRGFTFTDGQVLSLRGTPKDLTMRFRNSDALVEITFSGSLEFEIYDWFDRSITRSTLDKKDEGYRLTLFGRRDFFEDDEETSILIIDFADAEEKVISKRSEGWWQ